MLTGERPAQVGFQVVLFFSARSILAVESVPELGGRKFENPPPPMTLADPSPQAGLAELLVPHLGLAQLQLWFAFDCEPTIPPMEGEAVTAEDAVVRYETLF